MSIWYNKDMNELEKSILNTIFWFDIFDFPLTAREIYRYNFQFPIPNFQFSDFKEILEKSEELKKYIEKKYGFYFLKGKDNLVEIRKNRYLIAEKKYKKW